MLQTATLPPSTGATRDLQFHRPVLTELPRNGEAGGGAGAPPHCAVPLLHRLKQNLALSGDSHNKVLLQPEVRQPAHRPGPTP